MPLLAGLALAMAPTQPPPPPRFPADVRMIRLDVSVVDKEGRSVAGLQRADFTVLENGRPVEITFFEAVGSLRRERTKTATGPDGNALPQRRILLLVDTGPMMPAQLLRARQSTTRYLREATSAGDWVRLVNLSPGRAWNGRIPRDRLRLEAAARSLSRRADPWSEAGGGEGFAEEGIEDRLEVEAFEGQPSEAETRGRFLSIFAQASGLLGTLESLLVQLEGVQGRKALVLVSPGFPQLRDLDRRLERVASLAREAATAVYFLDAVGLDGLAPEPGRRLTPAFESAWRRSGGAQDLAEATGGFTSRFANSLLPALERIADEMQTYYILGYVPPRPEDGRFRSVKVRVNAPGVAARTKKGYLAGAP